MHRAALLLCIGSIVACGNGKAGDVPAAVATTGAVAGQVVELSGTVTATRAGATRTLAVGAEVHDDDAIATGADGRIAIKLARNDVTWRLGPNLNQVVARSSAWTAPRADDGVAAISGDRSAAAGRHAEREAADTAASATVASGAMPAPAAAPAAPADPSPSAPSAMMADEEQAKAEREAAATLEQREKVAAAPKSASKRARGGGGGRANPDDPLGGVDVDFGESFGSGGLGMTGTGAGGGGSGEGIGLGSIGTIGHGAGGGDGQGYGTGPGSNRTGGSLESRKLKLTEEAPKTDDAPPAITCVAGALSVSGARTKAEVGKSLVAVQPALQACAVTHDQAAAHVLVKFTIAADGKPGAIAVSGAGADFTRCAIGAIGQRRFAAQASGTTAVEQTFEIKR